MDIPLFHLDWLNNRMLIALIATVHALINHSLAVGFLPLMAWLENKGVMNSGPDEVTDAKWDKMVYKMMWTAFIITTTVGAMTGVGIWFSVSLVSPNSIASLIRVFYYAWFLEWTVFVTEVVLILIYFLTWKNANKSIRAKTRHIKFGWYLSVFSWVTMAIIVSILGFMMDPGNWKDKKDLITAFTNPLYIPQLLYRTPLAMVLGGVLGLFLVGVFTQRGDGNRIKAFRAIGKWILCWLPFAVAGSIYYFRVIPETQLANMSVAIGTQAFQQWYDIMWKVILAATSIILITAIIGVWKPKVLRVPFLAVTLLFAFAFMGLFERVREFIRKPYIIREYMYSNLLREEDYPLYKKDGILKWATYTSTPEITPQNKIEAGRNVFMLACSRCHTTQGVNSVVEVFDKMYGSTGKPFDAPSMKNYVKNLHNARAYMPPFPGNKKEIDALVAYIKQLQVTKEVLEGAQETGVTVNPGQSVEAYKKTAENNLAAEKTESVDQKK
ncbi:MAG: cytochrome c [Pedobacter sp.]|nr:MAG: cytochrome c [Pedobacter sp.]